ncbi:MAG TPA: hypothetical protein VH650_04990 [Gaiellaceae bacterium]|jgi:hypothetical protein
MRTLAVIAAVLAAALPAACGGDDDAAGTGTTAISIDEALASDSSEPMLVSGNLLTVGEDVKLCYALAESFPPQCGGASLAVDGLDLATVDGLVTEGDVSWTDRPIELRGVVSNGTLTVSENAQE